MDVQSIFPAGPACGKKKGFDHSQNFRFRAFIKNKMIRPMEVTAEAEKVLMEPFKILWKQ
jgi:hypothetical protein